MTCSDPGEGEWNRAKRGVCEGRGEEADYDPQAFGEGYWGVGDRDELMVLVCCTMDERWRVCERKMGIER